MTAELGALAMATDVDLGVRLLAGVPTNGSRSIEQLRRISERSLRFGALLAATDDHTYGEPHPVVERTDGLRKTPPVLARYRDRGGVIELYLDSLAACEELVDRLGWQSWFPPGSLRAAAVLHERAHHLVSHRYARDLRVSVGVPAVSIGPWTRFAHVAGAHEVAAHAFAQHSLGLGRSPLLLTAAASAAFATPPTRPVRRSRAGATSSKETSSWAS